MLIRTSLLAIAIAATGCVSGRSARQDVPTRVESKSVPGLELELLELVDGKRYAHPPDAATPDRIQEVDTRSTLRLTFTQPPDEASLRASPEWRSLEQGLEELSRLLEGYRLLSEEAARLPAREFEGTQAFQQKVGAFAARQQEFVNGLVGSPERPGMFTRGELTAVITSADGPYARFAARLKEKLDGLSGRARGFAESKDDVLVTVRARVEPEVGSAQWLQVPGYWEKSGDAPATDESRSRSAEMEKLRAEFAAAQRVAAMIGELRARGSVVSDNLQGFVRSALDGIERRLRELVDARRQLFDDVLARRPAAFATDEERAFWDAAKELRDVVDAAIDAWQELAQKARSGTPFEQIEALTTAIDKLVPRIQAWKQAVAKVQGSLPRALQAATEQEVRSLLERLKTDLQTLVASQLEALLGELPRTAAALADLKPLFRSGNQVLAGVDALPRDAGTAIPHPPDDLPRVDLDMTRQPVTPGDDLHLEVAFYKKQAYVDAQAPGKPAAVPLETIAFSSRAIKSGWIWSGDVIFTQRFSGSDDKFDSSAAVSYERHWRDREHPDGWLNRFDPGLGFHAAVLNFDPDESAEVGVGLNASLFRGLIRAGVGYDISVGDDQEYFFFGFGLISALDRVKELGNTALEK